MALLLLDRVSKTYYRGGRHRVEVLRDVSLDVELGELVAVLGDAMSGKTTLLRIAAGLEPPDQGAVWLDGARLRTTADRDPRIAVVARGQPPDEVGEFRMLDFVAMALLEDHDIKEARRRAASILDLFDLGALQRARWHELSDVERMLVRIAQAAVRKPSVLLIDDPLHGLRISHAEAILARLRSTAIEQRMAVITTVSDLPSALRADAVWSLSAGSLVKASGDRGRVVDFPAGRGGA